jgi:hypothetical protein
VRTAAFIEAALKEARTRATGPLAQPDEPAA